MSYRCGFRRCHVNGCTNTSSSNPDLGFIMVPTPDDMEKRLQWLKVMNREDIVNCESKMRLYVCERHFDKADIKVVNQRKNLINMNILPGFFLGVARDESASEVVDEESGGKRNSWSPVNPQTDQKRQRLQEILHTEVEIKAEMKYDIIDETKDEIKVESSDEEPIKPEVNVKRISTISNAEQMRPIDLFQLLLDPIVNFTKEITCRLYKVHQFSNSDFKVFAGLLLCAGSFNVEYIGDCWKKTNIFSTNFRRNMLRSKFLTILKYLRLSSSDQDSVEAVRPLLHVFNNVMRKTYVADNELLVEETWWKEQSIRMFLLREPCGFVIKFHLEESRGNNKKSYEEILLEIGEDVFDLGHLIYLESHQTSYELAAKLLKRNTYCIGALAEIPPEINAIKYTYLDKYEMKSKTMKDVHVGKLKMSDDEEIAYLTTHSSAMPSSLTGQGGKPVRSSRVGEMFNKTRFKVTNHLSQYYPCPDQQMTLQAKMFIHILMLSLQNAHCLYNKFCGTTMDFAEFRISVIKELLPYYRHDFDKKEESEPHRLQRLLVNGEINNPVACINCYRTEKKHSDTLYQCRACIDEPSLCVKCFCDIHNKS